MATCPVTEIPDVRAVLPVWQTTPTALVCVTLYVWWKTDAQAFTPNALVVENRCASFRPNALVCVTLYLWWKTNAQALHLMHLYM